MERSNRQVITVSDLNRDAKRLLESEFPILHVEGEISNLAQPGSGHWYFTLKDDRAQVRCAMFKNRNHMVRFKPRNGQQIVVRGRITLYEGRGEFQMIAEFLEDSGRWRAAPSVRQTKGLATNSKGCLIKLERSPYLTCRNISRSSPRPPARRSAMSSL